MADEKRDDERDDQAEAAMAEWFDPDRSSIGDPTTVRLLQLAKEIDRLRAAAVHWRDRALRAEPLAARAEDLQQRLNAKLAEESAARVARNGKPEPAPGVKA